MEKHGKMLDIDERSDLDSGSAHTPQQHNFNAAWDDDADMLLNDDPNDLLMNDEPQ